MSTGGTIDLTDLLYIYAEVWKTRTSKLLLLSWEIIV